MKYALFTTIALVVSTTVAHAQECVSDAGIETIEGFRVVRVHDRSSSGFLSLNDLEVAKGAYWSGPGAEGVLFTSSEGGLGAIGRIDSDGNFVDFLVSPGSTFFPNTAYLEYAYDDLLYACDTVGGNDIWRILPDGTVEFVADYPNCEGIAFGDRGDGVNALYVSSWTAGTVDRVNSDGTITPIASGFPGAVTDLAIPSPSSSFVPGLYAVQQSLPGIFHIDLANTVTLPYPYGGNLTGGEEGSFADPGSVFGDALYHPNLSNQLQRLFADGTAEVVAQGGGLDFFLITMGGVFSTDGRSYYFTNEATTIWRLEACLDTLDHFLSYDIKSKSKKSNKSGKSDKSGKSEKSEKSSKSGKSSKSAKFEKVEVELEDQFQRDTFTVKKRVALLNPVDKNGEGIADPETHLVGYQVKQFKPKGAPKPEKLPIIGITVTDQFFPDGLIVDIDDANKADRLLVPASKDLVAVPDPLDPVNVDHFLCYKVKPPKGTKFPKGGQVLLVDQFIDPGDKLFDIGKPRRLCNPVSKEFPLGTVSEIQSPESHLMCYSVKRAKGEPKHERTVIYLNDQFGPTEEWETRKEKELCLPAEKTLGGLPPDPTPGS